jgi:hypothetical protein
LRVGCRPERRKLEKCSDYRDLDYDYSKCAKIRKNLKECQEALNYFYYSSRKEEIFQYNKIYKNNNIEKEINIQKNI